MEFIVVDHHFFDEDVISKEVLTHINPFLVGEDGSAFSAGMLCTELARFINKDVSNISQIPALAGLADKIDLMKHQIRLDIAKGGKWRVTVTAPNLNNSHLSLLPIHIERRTLQNRFDKLTKRVLDKKMSFHILRHGFGNYQANVLKLPLPIVQQMMGHARLDTTGIYTRVNPEYAIGEAWRAMNGDS